MSELSHVDNNNNPTMVDVSSKEISQRVATAVGEVWLPENICKLFDGEDINSKKGPVFQTAIIAGVMGIKNTSNLIPFCHQLNIESIKINIELHGQIAKIVATVKNSGKTGVEMEALVGVQIAALTIYDMCKALSQEIEIRNCHLLMKKGGKSDYAKRQ
ncbi:MAG: cyclic pyranopterin monophosphate synthase MoaC [Halobacteriovoraceae bacterium]|nr:cyclic pyranopterin monophosphate synthase MoaC [Halobacteriovoraceae bacterium]